MDFLTEAIVQVPALGVMAWLVWLFLREMRGCREMFKEVLEGNTKALEKLSEEIHAMNGGTRPPYVGRGGDASRRTLPD